MILFLGIIFTSTICLLRCGNQNCLYNGIPTLAVYLHSFRNDSYIGICFFLFIWHSWTSVQHFHWVIQKALNSLSWSFSTQKCRFMKFTSFAPVYNSLHLLCWTEFDIYEHFKDVILDHSRFFFLMKYYQ